MTKFTDEQIKYLETKIEFLDEGNVEKGFNVRGNVWGSVWGSVEGNVEGCVEGDVWGDIRGSVRGNVWRSVEGNGIQTGEKDKEWQWSIMVSLIVLGWLIMIPLIVLGWATSVLLVYEMIRAML